MKPTLIQEAETVWNTNVTPKTTASFPVQAGDVLVAYSMVEHFGAADTVPNSPTITDSSGMVWTLIQSVTITDYSQVLIWSTTVDTSKSITVTFSLVQGPWVVNFGGNVLTFRGSSGIGNSAMSYSSGSPTLNIPTTQVNSALVMVNADWDALLTTLPSYNTSAGTFNETTYLALTGAYIIYAGYYDDVGAAGTKTIGITSPTPQKYSIAAVEVKGTGAAATGSIACTTTPAGASVAVDGVNQGAVTPVTLTGVSAGSHTVTFTLAGYNSCPVTVNVVAGSTVNASCTMTPVVTTGSISCTTVPSGASVALDGINRGVVTPTTLTNITPGSHTVTFTLTGYNACPVSVNVVAGSTATASCTMVPVVTTGNISCTTSPPGASVALDGINQGAVTPVTLAGVSAGNHTVTFTLSGYNACPVSVNVVSGSTVNASCTMVQTCPNLSCNMVMIQ